MHDVLVGSAQAAPLQPISAVLFALLGIVVVFSVERRPWSILTLLFFAIPFNLARAIAGTTVDAPKIVIVAVLFVFLIRGRIGALVPPQRSLRALAMLGVLSAALDALGWLHASERTACLREALKALEYVSVLLVAVRLARDTHRPLDRVVPTLSAIVAIVSGVALFDEVLTRHSVLTIGGTLVTRIAGPLEGPNQLSGYLQLFVPVLVAAALATREGRVRWMAGIAAALGWLALALTFSRAGIASAALTIVIAVALHVRSRSPRVRFAIASGLAFACAVLAIAFRGSLARDSGTDDREALTGLATRRELWHAAVVLWQRDPLLGIGAGNYEFALPSTGLLGVRTHANNYYLQTLAEGGIVSLAAAFAMLGIAIAALARRSSTSWLAGGVFAATIGIAAHQGFDDLFFFPKVGATWWALVGVALVTSEGSRAGRSNA